MVILVDYHRRGRQNQLFAFQNQALAVEKKPEVLSVVKGAYAYSLSCHSPILQIISSSQRTCFPACRSPVSLSGAELPNRIQKGLVSLLKGKVYGSVFINPRILPGCSDKMKKAKFPVGVLPIDAGAAIPLVVPQGRLPLPLVGLEFGPYLNLDQWTPIEDEVLGTLLTLHHFSLKEYTPKGRAGPFPLAGHLCGYIDLNPHAMKKKKGSPRKGD